jgi:hypothetical protein
MSARLVSPGILVTKAAQNIPQTATANLYTVAGGSVLITGLLGVVTTAIGATATTLSLGTAPGAQTTSIATATAITSSPVGTVLFPVGSGGKATALVVAGAGFVLAPPAIFNPFVLGAGTTNITWTTSANDTGQVQFYLWYTPIDFDATVT